jgi:SAM-dependent methyltransferase
MTTWDKDEAYGDLFYKRAIGELPEMESSKSVAQLIKGLIRPKDSIVDVGCGAGHYLTSLRKAIDVPFGYWGIDSTQYYIDQANRAFDIGTFTVGDIYDLKFPDGCADIVMCNNVLLHLPSIEIPIRELLRISSRYVVIRTLVGNGTFIIKQSEEPEEYRKGELVNYHYFNIYSSGYIASILKGYKYEIRPDMNFDPQNLGGSDNFVGDRPTDLTVVVGGYQVNGYIIQPWKFIIIDKRSMGKQNIDWNPRNDANAEAIL